ncbi:MAG: ABC transporter ATP-binding protein [Propionibacteriaceae bacterium]|nr:ABC transporter ATP-binding protein [Propionibacteriaceae bacterium]
MVAPGEKAANFRTSLKRLLRELRPQRVRIVIAIMFGVAGVTLSVVGPKILGQATTMLLAGFLGKQFPSTLTREQAIQAVQKSGNDDFVDLLRSMDFTPGQGVDFNAIGMILITVLVLYLISGVASYVQAYVLNDAVQQSILRMRQKVSQKIDRLPLSYFDNQPRGELLSRVTNDIDNVSQTLQQTLSQLLNSLLMVVGVLAMMFWISPTLALVALVSVPVAMLMVSIIGKRSQVLFKANWKSTGDLNAHIEEAYTGHSLVKVFGRQKEVAAEFEERNEALFKAAFGSQFISGLMMPIMMLVGNLNYVVIAVIGGLRVASGTMAIGDVQAFIQYSRQFTQPLTQVASMANLMQSGVASAERVFELMDAQEMTPEPAGELNRVEGHVTFDDVDFRYSPDKPLIDDLSLEAHAGQTVAIVGPTGAGKTTLVNLLMRFYDLEGGKITMDGIDIATVPRADVRRNIGMVLQDTWLFGGTIRDNIAYGRPGASEEDIVAAATATFVDRFVHSLPEGYDTVIDEEGSNISAGEKQLITIARAFLADPGLLILDEATSSVDTRTELLVQQAMSALRHGRTSFVIAHRLSTIRDADLILVMEQGAIVEKGTHDELLASGGAYHDLYQSQFSAAVTP